MSYKIKFSGNRQILAAAVFIMLAAAVILLFRSVPAYAADFGWETGENIKLTGEGPDTTHGNIVDANCNTYWDGEQLWVFYTGDNVFNRYVGPDMDHLTKLEPSKLIGFDAFHGDDVYWTNGIYVDENGRWYTTLHVEYNYGNGAAHERKIMYAISDDNAATWTRRETIITGDGPENAAECQGRYETFGCGDNKLYVDEKSGYIYCYYAKSLIDRKSGEMFKTICAARSPISAKMAKGSWQKWYNGEWCEPGIGGHDSPLFSPPSTAAVVTYNTYLERYMAIGFQKPSDMGFISTCTSLEENDWTTPQYFSPQGKLGWYFMFMDMNTKGGEKTGRTFRIYNFSASTAEPYYFNVTLDKSKPADSKDCPYFYPDYSGIKSVSYLSEYNDILNTVPPYAYCESFDGGAYGWTSDGAELAVAGQQNVLNVKNNTENKSRISPDFNASLNSGASRFTVNLKSGSGFGVYLNYNGENDYLLLSYLEGSFTLQNAHGETRELYSADLKHNYTYGIRAERYGDNFTLKIDENTVFDGKIDIKKPNSGSFMLCSYPGTEVNYDDILLYDGVRVLIDDYEIALEAKPVLKNDVLMAPVRRISELFGAYVEFDASADRVIIKKTGKSGADTEILFTIGSSTAYVNGKPVDMGEASFFADGCAAAPLKFLAEAFGASLTMHKDAGEAHISSNGKLFIKLPQLEPWETEFAEKGEGMYVNDYLEDFKTTHQTIGQFSVVNDNRPEFDVKTRIYRHSVYSGEEEYARVYKLDTDINDYRINVYCVENIARYYNIYLSKDGSSWTQSEFTNVNTAPDPNRSGMYFSTLMPKTEIGGGYVYLKIELAKIGETWRNQLCGVKINYNEDEFVKNALAELEPPEFFGSGRLPESVSWYPVNISWSIEKNDYTDNYGNILKYPPASAGNVKIKAAATAVCGGKTSSKTFYISVPAQSGNIVTDDANTYGEGTPLQSIKSNEKYGWADGWLQKEGSAEYSKTAGTPYGKMAAVSSPNGTSVSVSREISADIDLDTARTYYITWQQSMTLPYENVLYRSQRVIFDGALIGGERNKELSAVAMADFTDENYIDGDSLPVWLIFKAGDFKLSRGPNNEEEPFLMVKGQTYTFVMRIDASGTEDDTVYLKAYPAGAPEPDEWQLEASIKLGGKISGITLKAETQAGKNAYFGNIQIESLNERDASAHDEAENALKSGNASKAEALLPKLCEGAWKNSIISRISNDGKLVLENIELMRNGVRVSDINGEKTELAFGVTNNGAEEKSCDIAAASYKDGVLTDCQIISVSAASGETAYLTAAAGENADEVKLFMFDSMNNLKPLRRAALINERIFQ